MSGRTGPILPYDGAMTGKTSSNHAIRWLLLAVLGVLAWRVLGLFFPHTADTDPEGIRRLLALLGLWFTGWGLWTYRQARDLPSLLFACYGIAAGIHWGGPIGIGPEAVQNLLLAVYVVVSTALAQSLFLHLALSFPPPYGRSRARTTLGAIYLPPALAVALLIVLAFRPEDGNLLKSFFLFFPVGALYSFVGAGIWIHRLIAADPPTRRARRLPMVVAALLIGWLPHAAASSGLVPADELQGLFNFGFAVIPPALAFALARPRSD